MLRLQSETDPQWAVRAQKAMPDILLDHAHCEKKAASTALSLIFRYPEYTRLHTPLSELAREELEHFEQVLEHLKDQGVKYGRQRPSPYAGKLMCMVRQGEPQRLLDTLLVCALIEARSCERMKLLAETLADKRLAELYRSLLASEARHHTLFVELALLVCPEGEVKARLHEMAVHEAKVLAQAPDEPRLHN